MSLNMRRLSQINSRYRALIIILFQIRKAGISQVDNIKSIKPMIFIITLIIMITQERYNRSEILKLISL